MSWSAWMLINSRVAHWPSHSDAHLIQREKVRERKGDRERSEEANEPALVQSQHHRHKSRFCTISSRLS
ncbi:hypothetical protein PBY51_011598 [Eleginops maclovinus]|uniref:Uncharacterized protein n=1 Tax=Eleginops maclovinus TaxID=56733 RepID=A0AAN7XUX7_ELEMC|nr:hypothetical protein PBY51_011598 [Eleginops maclovinus]